MNKDGIYYPGELNLELLLINEDTNQFATVTIGFGLGADVSLQEVKDRIEKFVTKEIHRLPDGFNLPSRKQFLQYKYEELTGEKVYIDNSDWDQPALGSLDQGNDASKKN